MGCEAGEGIFIVIPSLDGWPTKVKKAPSPHEVRLTCWTATQYVNVSG